MPRVITPPGVYVPLWIAPNGTEWPLNPAGTDVFTMNAITGIGVAPVAIIDDPDPAGGTTVQNVQARPRTITWPIRMRGRTHMEFLDRWRGYGGAFAMTRRLGAGTLRLSRPDGTAREIRAFYQAGFDVQPGQGWIEDTPVVSLYCPDPFWTAVTPTVITRTFSEGDDFLDPYPMISSGSVLGATIANNPGEVEAWPTWNITGPMTALTAINNTTGEQFTLTFTLTDGEQIVISTRPQYITGPMGQNLVGDLNWPGAELWRLEPGDNDIEFNLTGADVGTEVSLTFFPRYEMA